MGSLQGHTVLLLGASNVVCAATCQILLESGARVVVVARKEEKLKELVSKFSVFRSHLLGVVGNLETRAQIEEIRSVVRAALGGDSVNHVISALGSTAHTPDGISTGDVNALRNALDDSLFPTILCAQVFLQDLRDKEGSTYTIVTGGFAHKCSYPRAWIGTIKNAAINGVVESLACDLAHAKVRINSNCLHYGIRSESETQSEDDTSSVEFARTFLKIIERKDLHGAILCQDSRADTERFLQA